MSASTHWLATAAAQAVLERGGNAFDAAVAGAFVLHVVEPHLNGPGGDMTGVFVTADEPDRPVVLMGQGPAPAAATVEHYLAEGLDLVPGSGALAAAVPAAVDAWLLLLRDHGTWELDAVLDFAIGYARDGHPMLGTGRHHDCCRGRAVPDALANLGRTLDARRADSRRRANWCGTLRMPGPCSGWSGRVPPLPHGRRGSMRPGASGGRGSWPRPWWTPSGSRTGTPPARTTRACSPWLTWRASRPGTSLPPQWSSADTRSPRPDLGGRVRRCCRPSPCWTGFEDGYLDPSTELGVHTILEAQKLALADREAYYGDTDVPLDYLLSAEYCAARRALIGERASHEFRPGTVPGRVPYLPPLRTAYTPPALAAGRPAAAGSGVGEPTVAPTGETRGDTCHIDVVDRWGNMVSATPSGGWLQSSPAIPELGFCLGTRLQMTWLEPGTPSTLTPGKRPRTTLTPTLVLRDGAAVTALGSPGGDQQDQWQLPYLLRTIVGGYSPQQAIDAPTFHTTSMPGSFWPRTWEPGGAVVEDRLGEHVIAGLERRGHVVTRAGGWTLGRCLPSRGIRRPECCRPLPIRVARRDMPPDGSCWVAG